MTDAFRLLLPWPGTAQWRELAPWEQLGRIVFSVVLLIGCVVATRRMIDDAGSDFPEYYRAGRYVAEHGARQPGTILVYYWPSLDVAWAPLGALPFKMAAGTWCVLSCGTWLGLLGAVHRYLLKGIDERIRRQTLLAVALMVLPVALLHLTLGAFHVLMLWWLVAGLGRVSEGRIGSGAVVLGLAVWIKLLPALAVGYLLWKRQWKPAILAATCAVGLDVLLSVAAFGPRAAWEAHRAWWLNDSVSATDRILLSASWQYEHRCKNQSLSAVTRRLLTPVIPEPEPGARSVNLLDVPKPVVKGIYFGLLGLLGLGLAVVWRRSASATSATQWATEIALVVLATMWFSPVVWAYYFTALAPPLAVVLSRRDDHPRLALATALLWLATLALLGWPPARATGFMLWATFAIGVAVVRSGRNGRCTIG